jgi:hypothetical protein
MNKLSLAHLRIHWLLHRALCSGPACSPTPLSGRYQPGADKVFCGGENPFPWKPGWRYLGEEKISVRGEIWDSILTPVDEVRSLIFVREDRRPGNPDPFPGRQDQPDRDFPLPGRNQDRSSKAYPYREEAPMACLRTRRTRNTGGTGHDPRSRDHPGPSYAVKVLDRLPVDTAMVRIMELTPDRGSQNCPHTASSTPRNGRNCSSAASILTQFLGPKGGRLTAGRPFPKSAFWLLFPGSSAGRAGGC